MSHQRGRAQEVEEGLARGCRPGQRAVQCRDTEQLLPAGNFSARESFVQSFSRSASLLPRHRKLELSGEPLESLAIPPARLATHQAIAANPIKPARTPTSFWFSQSTRLPCPAQSFTSAGLGGIAWRVKPSHSQNPTFPSPLQALALSRTERFRIMQKSIYVLPI